MLEKIAQILTVANQPVLKSAIIQKCGLSSLQWTRYINQLLEAGLVDVYPAIDLKGTPDKNHRRMTYQTSRKGKLFLQLYNGLTMLLEVSSI